MKELSDFNSWVGNCTKEEIKRKEKIGKCKANASRELQANIIKKNKRLTERKRTLHLNFKKPNFTMILHWIMAPTLQHFEASLAKVGLESGLCDPAKNPPINSTNSNCEIVLFILQILLLHFPFLFSSFFHILTKVSL